MPSFNYQKVDTGSVTLDFDVLEVEGDDGSIADFDEMRKVWIRSPQQFESLVTIPRRLLAPVLIGRIRSDVQARIELMTQKLATPLTDEDSFSKVNVVNRTALQNAGPHQHHDAPNAHFVPDPSQISTAVYHPDILARVAQEVMYTGSDIEAIFGETVAFQWRNIVEGNHDVKNTLCELQWTFQNGLFLEDHAKRMTVLREIQIETARIGGLFEIDLGENGIGAVLIPSTVVHGRSVLSQGSREGHTGWRYFR